MVLKPANVPQKLQIWEAVGGFQNPIQDARYGMGYKGLHNWTPNYYFFVVYLML